MFSLRTGKVREKKTLAAEKTSTSCKKKDPEYSPKPARQTKEHSHRLKKLRLGSACKINYISLDRQILKQRGMLVTSAVQGRCVYRQLRVIHQDWNKELQTETKELSVSMDLPPKEYGRAKG